MAGEFNLRWCLFCVTIIMLFCEKPMCNFLIFVQNWNFILSTAQYSVKYFRYYWKVGYVLTS